MSYNQNAIDVYVDGGCTNNPGPGGWGFILIDHKFGRVCKGAGGTIHATNNEMELYALKEALKAFKRKQRPIIIHSDSQYLIGVASGAYKAKKNIELVNEVRGLLSMFTYSFVKVIGHSGNKYNELCDQMTYHYRGTDTGQIIYETLSAPRQVNPDNSCLPLFTP